MYIYVSMPYDHNSLESKRQIRLLLQRVFGRYVFLNKNNYPINAVFSNDRIGYTHQEWLNLAHLIDMASMVVVVKLKGWENCEVVTEEVAYAATRNKPIAFVEELI